MDRNPVPESHALRQYDHFDDCRVEIKTLFSRWCFLYLLSNAIDDISDSIGIANDTGERFPDLALATKTPEFRESLTLRGLKALPVTF